MCARTYGGAHMWDEVPRPPLPRDKKEEDEDEVGRVRKAVYARALVARRRLS